jgi:hypothetical protein
MSARKAQPSALIAPHSSLTKQLRWRLLPKPPPMHDPRSLRTWSAVISCPSGNRPTAPATPASTRSDSLPLALGRHRAAGPALGEAGPHRARRGTPGDRLRESRPRRQVGGYVDVVGRGADPPTRRNCSGAPAFTRGHGVYQSAYRRAGAADHGLLDPAHSAGRVHQAASADE